MADDRVLAEVHRLALAEARGDTGLQRRGDVAAEDVAQDVALEFGAQDPVPENWRAWARTRVKLRLIDLARRHERQPFVEETELERRVEHRMGPSAGVVARHQLQQVFAALSSKEVTVLTEHLQGASNGELAERHGYASPASVSTVVARTKKELRTDFPELRFDLAPQRPY